MPIHRQPAYRDASLHLPATERACRELLCLPIHPGLAPADIDAVCQAIASWSGAAYQSENASRRR